MKNETKKMFGFRTDIKTAIIIQKIAEEENRSVSNVLVNIVNQYLAGTQGKLLKNVKIVSAEDHAA